MHCMPFTLFVLLHLLKRGWGSIEVRGDPRDRFPGTKPGGLKRIDTRFWAAQGDRDKERVGQYQLLQHIVLKTRHLLDVAAPY